MVDDYSVAGFSIETITRRGRADGIGKVCRVHHLTGPKANAESAPRRVALAICRRLTIGRGAAPVDTPRHRAVWKTASAAKRRADSPGRALEIRFQKHQIHRQDHAHGHTTENDLERSCVG